jgi:hypothetical protein
MSEEEKRSVHTDALATLGTIVDEHQKRDAIHLAVEPVIAGQYLEPGQHITVVDGIAYPAEVGKGLGIVDPFLEWGPSRGDRFWFVMYPRQVRSLRHVWSHPAFPDEGQASPPPATDKEASERWLRTFCANGNGPPYDMLIRAALGKRAYDDDDGDGYGPSINDGEYFTIMGTDARGEIPPEMWDHLEAVTGLKNLPRAKYFSCSC